MECERKKKGFRLRLHLRWPSSGSRLAWFLKINSESSFRQRPLLAASRSRNLVARSCIPGVHGDTAIRWPENYPEFAAKLTGASMKGSQVLKVKKKYHGLNLRWENSRLCIFRSVVVHLHQKVVAMLALPYGSAI